MLGMERECGICNNCPSCSRRNKAPASTRASFENGGVLIVPPSQTKGFLEGPTDIQRTYTRSDIKSRRLTRGLVASLRRPELAIDNGPPDRDFFLADPCGELVSVHFSLVADSYCIISSRSSIT
jgi:hypothetical protein